MNQRYQWPKTPPKLDAREKQANDDFMNYWHQILPKKYSLIENFNHQFPMQADSPLQDIKTLEIGAGLGEHLEYEDLTRQDYYCVELRENMAAEISKRFPLVKLIIGDCQEKLDIEEHFFDRILAIHVLEHLPKLPDALIEIDRLLKPHGIFSVVIPCDPGLAYELGRKISAERIFRKRYNMPYKKIIRSEHINSPGEIISCLKQRFHITKKSFFPLKIPFSHLNLCIGMHLKKQKA